MSKTTIRPALTAVLALLLCALLCLGAVPGARAAGGGSSYAYISFDNNGGGGWMTSLDVCDETWTVPASEFTPPMGQAFAGWGLSPRGPVKYLPGDLAYNDGSATLYALWTDMTPEQLAAYYTPQNISIYSWNIGAEVDPDTGVAYATARPGWSKMEGVQDFTVSLNLGSPDGPRVPARQTEFSTADGSVTTSWSTSYLTVAAPFLADGVQQVVSDGAVNGLLDGDVVFLTLAADIDGSAVPGKPVYFTCSKPKDVEVINDDAAWFAESESGIVEAGDYTTYIVLTKNTTLPSGGLSLGSRSYYLDMNGHTLTGTLSMSYGDLYVVHPSDGDELLAVYASGDQVITFNGYGYSGTPTGSAVTTFEISYARLSYDPTIISATATNGEVDTEEPLTLATVNDWGYANTQEPITLVLARLSDAELAEHIPKDVAVTPMEEGLQVEWTKDPLATEAEICVDVVMNDGSEAHLSGAYNRTFVSPDYGPSSYAWSTGRNKNVVSLRVTKLGENEEQAVSDGYVNGFRSGQTLKVRVAHGLGGKKAKYQLTPFSDPVSVPMTQGNIGKTYTMSGFTQSRKYLPGKFTLRMKTTQRHVYNGEPHTLDYTVGDDTTTLTKDVDYTERYENNVEAGTAKLVVNGIGECSGELTQEFTIEGVPLNDNPGITMQLAYTSTLYDGTAQCPEALVMYGSLVLREGYDYELSYANNVDAGTATATATGIGNFSGTVSQPYTIEKRSLASSAAQVTLSQNRYEYTGEPCTPEVSAKWADTLLEEGVDYTLSYVNNVSAGTASAVLTGMGNYTDARNADFTIYNPVSLATDATIDPIAPQVYNGAARTPKVTVRVGSAVLTEGWDYTVAYNNNVSAGTGTVTVTGRRDYYDSATAAFTIDPADLASCTMTLSKSEYPYGEAVYAYNGGENKPAATLTCNGRTLYEDTDYTLSYVNNVDAGTATAVATGMGNYASTKSADFTVTTCDLNDVSASIPTVTYSGQAQTPKISMSTSYLDANRYTKYRYLVEGSDFTVTEWSDNVNAGTATVTVQATRGNFTGSRTIEFTINPMQLWQDDILVTADKNVFYTGQPVNPVRSIVWRVTGETLVEGRDYTITYYNYNSDIPNNEDSHNHTDICNGIEARPTFTGNFDGSGSYHYFNIVAEPGAFEGASGTYGGMVWRIDGEGTLWAAGAADLSYHSDVAFRPYRQYIRKIVLSDASTIYAGTFSDCPYVTEVELPDGLTSISYSVFSGCDSLQEINIPATVTTLNAGTFPDVHGLEIHLPDNIAKDNFDGSFEYSDNGTKVFVKSGTVTAATLSSSWSRYYYEGYPDFRLFVNPNYPEYGLQLERYTGDGGTVVVPDFIDYVYGYGLSSTCRIEKLVIPGSVSRLGTIQNSYGLREIEIKPGTKLTELPSHFNDGCKDITLYLPDNITSIGSPINASSDSTMLIVANCDSYAIEWAKGQRWTEEDGTGGPHYRLLHKNPVSHAGQEPTCEAAGWTDYLTCSACEYNSRQELPALGHSWCDASYVWNAAHTQVTATRVCRHDPSHTQTETAQATVAVVPATCVTVGSTTYTSAVFNNPAFRVQVLTEEIPLAAHTPVHERSKAATRTRDGVRGEAYCGVCDETLWEQSDVSCDAVLRVPGGLSAIGEEAFIGVAAEQVEIPSGATSIGDRAFADCDHLMIAVIPATVTSFGSSIFANSDVAVICPDDSPAAVWCDAHAIPHNH